MRYSEYKDYKNARLEWIDKIPSHWDMTRLRLLGKRYSGGTPDKNNDNYWYEGTVPWLNSGEVNQGKITEPSTYITELALKESSAKWIPEGAVIVALAGQGKTKGMAAYTTFKTTCNQSMAAIVFEKDHSPFMYWWLVSQYKNIRGLASDDGRDGLNLDMIGSIPCPIPSVDEQKKIAVFLDFKTKQIDELVTKKKELIEKLNEQRIAVITQAVTKGLNKKAMMKPSGVEWLGDVPEHWVIRKLKYVVSTYGGGTPNTNNPEYWNGDIPWVSPKDMKSEFIIETEDYLTKLGVCESSTKLVPANSVLIVVRSGILRHSIPVAINSVVVSLNQDMKALIPGDELCSSFLHRFIHGNQKGLLPLWSKPGCTVESIEYDYMANTVIAIPPIDEQKEITDRLNTVLKKMDCQIEKAHEAIDKLEEYRGSIITAAVTGKIDVRNIKIGKDAA